MNKLGKLVSHAPDPKNLDVQILAMSVDSPDEGKWAQEKLKADNSFLSDSKDEVARL